MSKIKLGIVAISILCVSNSVSFAQHNNPILHVNTKWAECSMQLDPSLSQGAWRQFTQEAGIMTVFNPLTSAKPLGKWNFDIGLSMNQYPVDDTDSAWNDTFVHPHSTHWLYADTSDDPGVVTDKHADSRHVLSIPLLLGRIGVTDKIDVGIFFFSAIPDANYAFRGGQVQYNFLDDSQKNLFAAVRVSIGQIASVEDFKLSTYSVDVMASKDISIFSGYAGLTGYLVRTHETTSAVDLDDENVFGVQGNIGVTTLLFSHLKIGAQLTVGALTYPGIVIGFSM